MGMKVPTGIVSGGAEIDRRSRLPASNHASAKELGTLSDCQSTSSILDGIVLEVVIEFGNELLQLAENHERAIQSPQRAQGCVTKTVEQDDTGWDHSLTW
jgi:hypothetical protein